MAINKQRLTIVHLLTSLQIGGAERFTIDLAEYQKSCGHRPVILSLGEPNDPLISVCKKLAIEFQVINGNKILRQLQLIKQFSFADVLHIHSPSAMRSISGILFLFEQKKVVYTRHGAAPLTKVKWRIAHQKVAPYIDYITFVSDEGRQNFQRTHQWQHIPHTVLDNGINVKSFSAKIKLPEMHKQQISLGMVGRMVELKHQISLLKALATLNVELRRCFAVHFFGDGPCRDELETFHQQQLNDMDITFHGSISQRDIIYSAFNVLLLTSRTEGLSLAIIEAMASEHAVIATRVGGNATLVHPEKTGWLFDYDDTATLADILSQLPEQIDKITTYGKNAQNFIEQHYSLQVTADQYEELYLH